MPYYFDSGNLNGKETLFFIHGFFMDSRMFNSQVDALKKEYRVVCVDVRCFGKSSDLNKAFSLYDVVDDVIGIANKLDIDKFIVCGVSMGGYVALRAAIRHPNRVKGLILIATQYNKDLPNIVSMYTQLKNNWGNDNIRQEIVSDLLPVFFVDRKDLSSFWSTIWNGYTEKNISVAMDALINRDCIDDFVGNITPPSLIIHGDSDHGIPYERGVTLNLCLKKSEIVIVKGAGHAVNMTHDQYVNEVILTWLHNKFN